MAEAATVIQLIQFSGIVLTGCYEYISKARNATAEIEKVLNDVSGLENILKQLQLLMSNPDGSRHQLVKSLGRPSGPFQACSQALQKLQKKLKNLTEASSARRRLMWPLEEGNILEILRRLGEQKQTFILALMGDHALSDDVNTRHGREAIDKLNDMNTREERSKILNWLSGTDPSTNFNTARKKHEKDTGKWLLHSEKFQSWKKTNGHIMWLYGIPGAGKTILSSTVVDHLAAENDSHLDCRIAYYYFDFNDPGKQMLIGCLKSLVQQMCAQTRVIPEPIMSLYALSKGRSPSAAQLIGALTTSFHGEVNNYIIIDALDECKEEEGDRERAAFFDALTELKNAATGCFNIFITSRPEADISSAMARVGDITLELQGVGVQDDIRSHIIAFMGKDNRMKIWPENVKDEVVKHLSQKANGMFRWAACQLESLRTCLKPKLGTIKQKLSDLPRTLDSTYERIFQQMNPEYEREMRTILMLLACSVRPMTIQEVAEATAVDLEAQSLDDRFPDPYDVLELCSSLVSLVDLGSDSGAALRKERGYSSWRWPSNVKIVQFAHFSVKEFILSDRRQTMIPPSLRFDLPIGQKEITEMCLIYLLDFNGGKRATSIDHEAFPMLAYAALHWTTHMAAMPTDDAQTIQELLVRLFNPDEPDSLMNFLNLYDPASTWRPFDGGKTVAYSFHIKRSKQDFETPLYYACHYGLLDIARWLVEEEDGNLDAKKERLGPALGAAAAEGHLPITQMIMKHGANPNSPYCGKYFSPLHAAATSGNPEVMKLLLEAGADVQAQGGEYGTPLHLAAKQGNPSVIQLLLDAGSATEIKIPRYGTPLYLAASHGNDEAVTVLVQNGANVNASRGGYYSPLIAAATHGGLESVKLLLDSGADINVPDASETALHCAAGRADLDIMRLLITRGSDVNGSGGTYGTPLKAAIQSHEPASFDLMLHSGADINARGDTLKFPVDQAIFGGNLSAADKLLQLGAKFGHGALEEALDYHKKEYLAKILLDLGANPNAEQKQYGNALQFAIEKSSVEAVGWLIDAGADVNAIEGEYGTALQAACVREEMDKVRLLLKHGADVNGPACGKYGHPLQAAAFEGNEEIFQLLLDYGTDVNATGGEYCTALQAVAGTNQEKETMVLMLLERGADASIVGGQYGTALRAALSQGHEQIVSLLLERGASPFIQVRGKHTSAADTHSIDEFDSVLEVAVSSGKSPIVQLLLNCGLDINSDADGCKNSLSRAARISDISVLEFLVQNGVDVERYGGDALSAAVDCEHSDHLELLLNHGADVNYVDLKSPHWGTGSALESSIHGKSWNTMHRLLDVGADVNLQTHSTYGTALQAAVEQGAREVAMELLERGAKVNLKAGYWGTALTRAAWKGDDDLLHILLDHGANVNIQHGYHGNALQAAIGQRYYDMAHELLDRGADPNLQGMHANALIGACGHGKPGQVDLIRRLAVMGCNLNTFNEERPVEHEAIGKTVQYNPLSSAAAAGNVNVATLLLELGADINAVGGTYGTALQSAVSHEQTTMAKLLIDCGADVNAVGGDHCTALQAAVVAFSDNDITQLLEVGADVNIEGGYYGSPLQAACRKGIPRFVQLLLQHGAKVNTHAGHFDSPLQAAAKSGSLEVVKLLLDHGAAVNAEGGKYGTPLQAACCDSTMRRTTPRNGCSVLELLLERGAHVNARGGKYGSPLQAAAYHHLKFVEILLKKGADPNVSGGKFGSPIQAARKKGLYRAVKLLAQSGAGD